MLFYRELPPPPDLDHLVLSFWEFSVKSDGPAPIMHEIFPDGCISIAYRKNSRLNFSGISMNTLARQSVVIPVFDSDVVFGVRLSPAAARRVLGCDPAGITKYFWDGKAAEHGIVGTDLAASLAACTKLEEAAVVYGDKLKALGIAREDIDEKVLVSVATIEQTRGETRIAPLAGELGLSTRQFERRFKKASGIPPKQYARARRFRSAATILVTGEPVNWAARAAEMGFADQAHLAREFSYLTGRSPKPFAEKVKAIDHGHLVT